MWMHWWNGKRGVDPKPPTPALEKPLQRRWDACWNPETRKERARKQPSTGTDGADQSGGKS
jgi:hypothetical protein